MIGSGVDVDKGNIEANPEQVIRKIRRARASVGAAFPDGHGSYLAAMIAFGAAATFLHHALRPERLHSDALTKLVTDQQEPYRGETHAVLAGGLLSDTVIWDFCPDHELLDETDRIAVEFAASLQAPPAVGDQLVACDHPERCPVPTAGVGMGWTDGSTGSTLFIPSTVSDLVQADPRTSALLLASRSIERYTPALGRQFAAGRLTTLYFVALSGSIRLIPMTSLSSLPAHRTFAGAGYFYTALSGDALQCRGRGRPRTATRPYFDVMGFGLVRTLCQPIAARTATASGGVVGTLCFDFTPPDGVTYQILAEASKLFDLQVVRMYEQSGIDLCPAIDGCLSGLPRLSSFSAGEIDQLAREWRAGPPRVAAAGSSAVRMLGDDAYFAAKIDHRDRGASSPAYDTLVFGRVRRSPTGDIASAIAMLVFAAIAAGVIIRGVRRKARRQDFTLIRGLQVGVVELNPQGVIVGANDRAEEILGMELPSFGGSGERVLFSSRIDPAHVVMLDDAGLLPEGPVTFSRYERIDDLRRAGDSSSYYAFTRATDRLIRVSGSTFVSARRVLHTFGTIDTYIDEAHRQRVESARAEVRPSAPRLAPAGRPR